MSQQMQGFYKFLWVFLMLIANMYDLFHWLISKMKITFKEISQNFFANNIEDDIHLLEECKKDLTKIPKHISIIIGKNQNCSPKTLSKLAVYALISDINYISFYDTTNKFTLEQIEIPKYISTQKMQNGRFLWSMPKNKSKSGLLKYKNGLERSIEVMKLTSNDCKPLLADVCKELCAKRNSIEIQNALKDKTILTNQINSTIQKKLNNLPNPDLVLVIDKTLCTFGLLPWHTGFSEFHSIANVNFLNVEMFANILCKFSKCEQRFGK